MSIIHNLCDMLSASKNQEMLVNGIQLMTQISPSGDVSYHDSPYSKSIDMYQDLQVFARQCKVRIDPLRPAGGGVVQSGSGDCIRWHCILPPIADSGPHLSLRRMLWSALDIHDFHPSTETQALTLSLARERCLFFSGATGAGKSSLLSLLMRRFLKDDRVFILETLPELPTLFPNWIRLVEQQKNLEGLGAFSLGDILRESLRMRPDHFVLGEIRGVEAKALYQILLSSHQKIWSTLHVSHPDLLVTRLAELSQLSEASWQSVFQLIKPVYVQLQRKEPRITGLFRYHDDGFKTISCDQIQV